MKVNGEEMPDWGPSPVLGVYRFLQNLEAIEKAQRRSWAVRYPGFSGEAESCYASADASLKQFEGLLGLRPTSRDVPEGQP